MFDRDKQEKIDALLSQFGDLHSAPQVARRVLALTRSLDFEIRQIVDCLESDPALAARIIRLANSPRYGLSHQVTGLRQAVAYLGQRSLRLATMSFTLIDRLTKGTGEAFFYDYWRRALSIAVTASRLADRQRDVDPDAAYTAGLLADVGALVFAHAGAGPYDRSASERGDPPTIEAERAVLGIDHAELGARLLERWSFTSEIVAAVHSHHDEPPPSGSLERVVCVAADFGEGLWTMGGPNMSHVRRRLKVEFDIDTDDFIDLAVGAKKEIDSQAEAFGFRVRESIDCEFLRRQAMQQQMDAALEAAIDLDSMVALFEPPPLIQKKENGRS